MRAESKLTVTVAFLFLLGCGVTPGHPDREPLPRPPPPQQDSVVRVRFSTNAEALRKRLDDSIPLTFGFPGNWSRDDDDIALNNQKDWWGPHAKYQAERQAVGLDVQGNVAIVRAPIAYQLGAHVNGSNTCVTCPWFSCGEPEWRSDDRRQRWTKGPVLEVTLSKALTVDSSWQLSAPLRASAASINPCNITVIVVKQDYTQKVLDLVNNLLSSRAAELDTKIRESVNLPTNAARAWDELSKGRDVGLGLSLRLNPSAMGLSTIELSDQRLAVALQVRVKPTISGNEPDTRTALPEPTPPGEIDAASSFNVVVDATATNAEISAAFEKLLVNKRYFAPDNRGSIVIKRIEFYGQGNGRAVVRVDFEGDATGYVYFVGTPKYEVDGKGRRMLTIPDLEFDSKTKDALQSAAVWLFRSKITSFLRETLVFDFAPAIDSVNSGLQAAVNSTYGNVALTGSLSFSPEGFYVGSSATQLRLAFSGAVDASLTIP